MTEGTISRCPNCKREIKTKNGKEFIKLYGKCDNCVEEGED